MHYLAAFLSILMGATGQYFFKIATTDISSKSSKTIDAIKIGITNPNLWIGLILYGLSLGLWLFVLSKMELSKAYPIISLGYVFTLILGYLFLNETITVTKITGITLIMIGVFTLTR